MIERLLDRPIAFQRVFVTLTGSVEAALMLSQAMYWSNRTDDDDGWFWKTREEWEEETGMKRSGQESARRKLRRHKFWEEELRGVPAKLHYRIDIQELENALRHSGDDDQPTSRQESNQPVGGKAASQLAGIQPTGRPGSSQHYTESTTEITTETTAETKDFFAGAKAQDSGQEIVNASQETNGTDLIVNDISEKSPSQTKTSSDYAKEPAPLTEWQSQVGALCWTCFGHDKVADLTEEKRGQLLREAKFMFKERDFTIDELREWVENIWRNDFRWKKNKQLPDPSYVRSTIARVRSKPMPKDEADDIFQRARNFDFSGASDEIKQALRDSGLYSGA